MQPDLICCEVIIQAEFPIDKSHEWQNPPSNSPVPFLHGLGSKLWYPSEHQNRWDSWMFIHPNMVLQVLTHGHISIPPFEHASTPDFAAVLADGKAFERLQCEENWAANVMVHWVISDPWAPINQTRGQMNGSNTNWGVGFGWYLHVADWG